MFIRTLHRRSLHTAALLLAFGSAAFVMLHWPQALANGVSRGLSICSGVIIPTLYPYMILAGFLTDSPLCTHPGKFTAFATTHLFRLPACCGPAILLSLVGGYPAGAIAIGRLRNNRQITDAQAQRMTLFCINGGPGFIVSTVGTGLLGSTRAGWLLFAAHAITSIGIGIITARGAEKKAELDLTPTHAAPQKRTVTQIVQDSCTALLTMCGFVLLATAGLSVFEASGISLALQQASGIAASSWSSAVSAVIEVSCGCIALADCGGLAPFWLSLCLGWGGLSVQGQLTAALKNSKNGKNLLTSSFWIGRLAHGCISGLIATVLFDLIPVDLHTVGQNGTTAVPFYASSSASTMLLFLIFTAMLCFYPKKTGNLT